MRERERERCPLDKKININTLYIIFVIYACSLEDLLGEMDDRED